MVLLNTGSTVFKGGAYSKIIFYSKQRQQGYFVIKKKKHSKYHLLSCCGGNWLALFTGLFCQIHSLSVPLQEFR